MERRGIPTISLAHQRFASPAHAQAKAMGMPKLPIAVVSQEICSQGTPEEVQAAADELLPLVLRGLTADPETASD